MMTELKFCALYVAVFHIFATPAAYASNAQATAELTEVSAGIWVRPGNTGIVFEATEIANIGAIVGNTCVAVIDTGGSPAEGAALRRAIEKRTELPICYVVNTHGHPDHILGNKAFADIEGVQFIGHIELQSSTAEAKQTWLSRLSEQLNSPVPEDSWHMPETTVQSAMSLDLGNRRLQLHAVPSAHSHSDLTVYDENTRTLWLSDLLFSNHLPVLAGSIQGWIEYLSTLDQLKALRVVPGHGPPSFDWPHTAFQHQLAYLKALKDSVLEDIRNGISLYDAQRKPPTAQLSNWPLHQQYHARNVARAWAELEWLD